MAIVKMKRLYVMAMADQQEALLKELLRLGCVEISEPDDKLADPAWSALLERGRSNLVATRTEIADVNTALAAIRKYAQLKDGMFIQRHPISEQEFLGENVADAREVSRKIGGLLQTLSQLQSEEGRLTARQASLLPWKSLDIPLEMEGTEHTLARLVVCPASTDLGGVRNELAGADLAAELLECGSDKQQRYGLLICHRADEDAVWEVLRPRSFSAVTFQAVTGTPAENLAEIERELAENRKRQQEATEAITQCAGARDALRVYADRLSAEAAKESSAERLMTDGTIVFFQGWAPAEKMGAVEALLEKLGCAWEASDPTPEEYPSVPIQLKNNALTRPLNMVTEMYSLPAYSGVDPNPLMAPFFIVFFGLMLADMGYGILMILASWFVGKKYRPKGTTGQLFQLMGLCGVSTFIWGALTGGFFGDFIPQLAKLINPDSTLALPSLFTPLNDALMVLIGSLVLGVIQIFTGMAVSIYQKVRRGQVMDAVCDETAWYAVFVCFGLAAVTGAWNIWMPVILVILVLTQGYGKKGIGGKLMGIGGSLYNHITGYFSDILSYSRLMALMLAGAVIAQVFNTLGAITGNIFFFFIISIIGNALNFGLNLLGCYVHDLRLQCLEYFGRFYEDGGKPFIPLAMDTKYVDVVKE